MPTIEMIRNTVSELGKEYGAKRISLFGSYARGDMTEDSDIDLLIDKGRIRGLEFASLLCDLEEAFGKHVDLISVRGANQDFLNEVKKDEVLIYER